MVRGSQTLLKNTPNYELAGLTTQAVCCAAEYGEISSTRQFDLLSRCAGLKTRAQNNQALSSFRRVVFVLDRNCRMKRQRWKK
jgi:hypothetical protein